METKEERVNYLGEKLFLILPEYLRSTYFLRGCIWIIYKSFHISKQAPQGFSLQLFIRLRENFKLQNRLSLTFLNEFEFHFHG